jgi:competence ComEA-like helix-hairpin-helix protein
MRSAPTVLALLLLFAPLPIFGADKLRLNEATQEQLLAVGFTQSQVVQIINYRKENGDFLQVEELLAVPQVSRATFDKVHDKLTVDE